MNHKTAIQQASRIVKDDVVSHKQCPARLLEPGQSPDAAAERFRVFSGMDMDYWQSYYLLGLLGVGVILGVVFLRTANLTAAVYVHGLYNLISLLALATGNGEEESILDKPLGWPLAVAGFVVVIWALRRLGSDATVESTWKTGRGAGPD